MKYGVFLSAWRLLFSVVAMQAVLLRGTADAQILPADHLDREELTFIQQLTARQLFDLAELHCRRLMTSQTTVDGQAFWLVHLCQTYGQHAWWEAASNRDAIHQQALDAVDTFLDRQLPSVMLQCRLKISQATILNQKSRMGLMLNRSGYLAAEPEQQAAFLPAETLQAMSAELTRSVELSNQVLQAISDAASDLDRHVVRDIRDHARLLLGEAYLLKTAAAVGGRETSGGNTEKWLSLSVRTSGDFVKQMAARFLKAELALIDGDDQQFDLLKRGLVRHAGPINHAANYRMTDPEVLEVYSLICRQRPSDALELAGRVRPATAIDRQRIGYLQLEAAVILFEMSHKLQDAALIAEAQSRYGGLRQKADSLLRGVFREAGQRTGRRYSLVMALGAENADRVRQGEILKQGGEARAAHEVLAQVSDSVKAGSPSLVLAEVLLRDGELLISLKRWAEAGQQLKLAADMFDGLKSPREAAVADLLRIYSLGQQWKAESTGRMSAETSGSDADADSQTRYRVALEQHVEKYGSQATVEKARQWLVQLLGHEEPLQTARLLAEGLDKDMRPDERVRTLIRLGELLVQADRTLQMDRLVPSQVGQAETDAAADRDVSPSVFDQLVNVFAAESETILPSEEEWGSADSVHLQLVVLEVMLRPEAERSLKWPSILRKLGAIQSAVDKAEASDADSLPGTIGARLLNLKLIALARAGALPDELQVARSAAERLSSEDMLRSVLFVGRWFGSGTAIRNGDLWLAQLSDSLIRKLVESDPQSADGALIDQEIRVGLFLIGCRTSHVTTDAELLTFLQKDLVSMSLTVDRLQLLASVTDGFQAGQRRQLLALAALWNGVAARQRQGSATWLECSLQLARLEFLLGDNDKVQRRLAVVELLYPEWGDADRRARAAQLKSQLNSANTSNRD